MSDKKHELETLKNEIAKATDELLIAIQRAESLFGTYIPQMQDILQELTQKSD